MDPNQYNPRPGPYSQTPPNYQGPAGPYVPRSPYGPPPSPYSQQSPYPGPQQQSPPGYLGPNPYAGYNPEPYEEELAPKPKSGMKPLIITAVAGLALVVLVISITVIAGSDKPATPEKPAAGQTANPALADIASRPDGVLDLSAKIETSKTIRPQSIQAKVKEQINLSSGFSFLVKASGTYNSASAVPATGKKLIILQVVVGNRAQSENISVSYLDFKLKDSSNNLLNGHPATQQVLNNLLASPSAIKPGEQIEGRLIYEVEAAETEWALIHKETYQKTTDNTTFTLEASVAVKVKPDVTPVVPPTAVTT